MGSFARCIDCGTTDVEFVGTSQYNLDEYYCHSCEKYFEIDLDLQDEIEEEFTDFVYPQEIEEEDGEDDWENEGGQ